MKRFLRAVSALALVVTMSSFLRAEEKPAAGPMIVHDVYFTLKDNSPEAKKKLVAACKKYLTNHAGATYFSAGVLAEEVKSPFNDSEFDVALHIVFKDKAALDAYIVAERHKMFVEENKDGWKKVRVFDSAVEPIAKPK